MKFKSKLSFSLIFLAFSFFNLFSQEDSKSYSNWSVYWHPGSNWKVDRQYLTGILDFLPYAENSSISYDSVYSSGLSSTLQSNFSFVNFGIQFSPDKTFFKKEKNTLAFRANINYLGKNEISRRDGFANSFFVDSTYFPEYDFTVQVDSIHGQFYHMTLIENTVQIQLEALHKIQFNDHTNWYYGFSLGISNSYKRELRYSKVYVDERKETVNEGNYANLESHPEFLYSGSENIEFEKFKLKNQMGFLFAVPLGIEYTLSQKPNFWNRTRFFYEVQNGVRLNKTANNEYKATYLLNHGFGFRFLI